MTGDLKTKLLLLVAFIFLGIAIRFGLKRWGQDRNLLLSERSATAATLNGNSGATTFTNVCRGLEENTIRGKKFKPEQLKFIKATSSSFCYCMNVQLQKSKIVTNHSSIQRITATYFNFLKSARGQKIYDYCNQVARYEVDRKAGRPIPVLKPPPVNRAALRKRN